MVELQGAALSDQLQFLAVVLMIVEMATIIAIASRAYVGLNSILKRAGEFNFSSEKALGFLMRGNIAGA